jgi:hypothetical protein
MRIVSILGLTALFAGAVPTKIGDYDPLPEIQRIKSDWYESAQMIVETRGCRHIPVDDEDALLKYLGPGVYEIIWEDHSTCDVGRVISKELRPI